MKAVFFLVLGAVLLGCAHTWKESDLLSEKEGCTSDLSQIINDAQGSEAICGCYVDELKEKYSYEEVSGDLAPEVTADLKSMLGACGKKHGYPNLLKVVRWFKGPLSLFSPVARGLADDRQGTNHAPKSGLRRVLENVRPVLPAQKLAERIDIPEVHLTSEGLNPLRRGTLQVFFSLKNGAEAPRFYSFKQLFEGNKKQFELTNPAHPNSTVNIEILSYEPLEYTMTVSINGEIAEFRRYYLPWDQEEVKNTLDDSHPAKVALDRLSLNKADGTEGDSVVARFDSVDGTPARFSIQLENSTHVTDDSIKQTIKVWKSAALVGRFGVNEKALLESSSKKGEGKIEHQSTSIPMRATYAEGLLPSGGPSVSVEFLDAEGKSLGVTREFFFGKEKLR